MNRRAFTAIVRAGGRLVAQSSVRVIDGDYVVQNMVKDGHACYLRSIGGGDEELTFTVWTFPVTTGDVTCVIPMTRTRLHELRL